MNSLPKKERPKKEVPKKAVKPTPRHILVYERIGELICALVERGKITELRVERWSAQDRHTRWGQIYGGKVGKIEKTLGGAFVDMGLADKNAPYAFLPFVAGGPILTEGQLILVKVVRETEPNNGATNAKGPLVTLADVTAPTYGLIEDVPPWHGLAGDVVEADEDAADMIMVAVDLALSAEVPISEGGTLSFEQTRALLAIDVDMGSRKQGNDAARAARALNLAAIPEIVRQVRLRQLGGLMCIDFAGPRKKADSDQITLSLRAAFDGERNGGILAPKTDILPLSRFGIAEVARQKRRATLAQIMLNKYGERTDETLAINVISEIEKLLKKAKGAWVIARVPTGPYEFLMADSIGWKKELADLGFHQYKIEKAIDGKIDIFI